VIVADDQPDPAQARGHQALQEAGPAGPVLGREGDPIETRFDGDLQSRPRISRCPSELTLVAMAVATFTTRPPSRQRCTRASIQTYV
jgi:hypothetical protein